MTFDSWLLALHLLSAFALVGSLTMFSIGYLLLGRIERPAQWLATAPVFRVGTVAVSVGVLGTIIFGIWLAISIDRYQVWDFWVIAAIVLWVIGSETGRRSGEAMKAATTRAQQLAAEGRGDAPDPELAGALTNPRAHMFHWISCLMVVLILVDMIWKPGA